MSRRMQLFPAKTSRRWLLGGLCIAMAWVMATSIVWLRTPSWTQVNLWIDLRFADVPSISTVQLASLLSPANSQGQAPLLLDVRTAPEYAISHLPGAKHVETEQVLDFAEGSQTLLDRAYPIVVYCSVGVRSAQAVRDLQLAGFTQVKNLRGSIFQWANEGRALQGGPQVHPYNAQWGQLLRADLRSE
jgi:rhodanese-related sulfurtransferase